MSGPRYAHLASRLLEDLDGLTPPPVPADRARTVAALERTLSARGRRRRRIRWGTAVTTTVAAIAVAVICGRRIASQSSIAAVAPPSGASVVTGSRDLASASSIGRSALADFVHLDNGSALPAGSRVVTPADGRATLSFASGTSAWLNEATDVTVASNGAAQIIRLETGSVDLQVAKLAVDQRFLVDTPDSEVEVRGTRFRVSVVPPDAGCDVWTKTRVSVVEGVVIVRHGGAEVRLGVGDRWPSQCDRVSSAPQAAPRRRPAPSASSSGSTLADQNNLFMGAVSVKHRGDSSAALLAFERFLATYPESPLAESAAVERMRLMRDVAPARSATAAREYVARYPNGFARSEAEAIIPGEP